MKTSIYRKTGILLSVLLLALSITSVSCKKKDDTTTPAAPTTATGTIAFHLHTNIDTAEVDDYGAIYTTSAGRKVNVTMAQLYLSHIQLVKLDGSTYDLTGVIKLKKTEEEEYILGNVPVGNYKSVKFKVGLDSTTNASAPASSDSTLHQPAMWFGNTAQPSGFVFINFEGSIDTTTNANGLESQMQPFSYKIGTNSNLKSVTMPDKNYTVSENQTQFVHIIIDYNMLFMGIPLNNPSNLTMNTTAANATIFGQQLADMIPMMFSYEE